MTLTNDFVVTSSSDSTPSTRVSSNPIQKEAHPSKSTKKPVESRQRKLSPSNLMNDRFPMLETGRNSSAESVQPRPKRIPKTSERLKPHSMEPTDEQSTNNVSTVSKRGYSRSPDPLYLPPRSASTLANYSSNVTRPRIQNDDQMESLSTPVKDNNPTSITNRGVRTGQVKSAFDLRGRYVCNGLQSTTLNDTSATTYMNITRKPITGRALDGDTLRMILEGPYGDSSTRTPSPLRLKKENSPHVALMRMGLEGSPAESNGRRTDEVKSQGGGSASPGHRMASSFLESRGGKSLERIGRQSPAFL